MKGSNSKANRGRSAVMVTTIGATVAGVAGATAFAVSLAGHTHAITPAASTQNLAQQSTSGTTSTTTSDDGASVAPWVAANSVQPPTQSSSTGSTSPTHAS